MPIENHVDCPALHERAAGYPYGDRVPLTVRMLKTTTADPMPVIGFAYIKGPVPVAAAGETFPAWTNKLGAVSAVMPDGTKLGLRPGEFEVSTWQQAHPPTPRVTRWIDRANHLYLAGPMTGFEDFNFPAFNSAAAKLRAIGYVVENPSEHGVVDDAEWRDYMAYDLTRLGLCGIVAVLPGWENSKGARLEVLIAERLGMTVVNAHDLVSMETA